MAPIDVRPRGPALCAGSVCLFLLGIGVARALAPHEVALLINADSPASLEVANHYCAARHIPLANRVFLRLPPEILEPAAELTPEQFDSLIWQPTIEHLRAQKLSDHVLAWVYSVDFPVRIRTQPPMSLQGLTLLRGEVPSAETLEAARYVSPYYAGPDEPQGAQRPSRSFSLRYFPSLDDLAVPSFSLGHVRSRGVRPSVVLENIARSVAADHTAPEGAVLFITNNNVRSTARAWQYPGVAEELRSLGRSAEVTPTFPRKHPGLLGVMAGSVRAPWLGKCRFVPGALADHLTSHAANFDAPVQGKMSDWLRYGATASAGTVTEPYALWPKFPHARLYAHYAAGATVLESYYQAVRCPLQLYMAGDPLCAPFAPRIRLTVHATPMEDPPMLKISSQIEGAPKGARQEYSLYLDDQLVLRHVPIAPTRFSLQGLADGIHTVRLVVESEAPIRQAAFGDATFELARRGRGVRMQPQPEPLPLALDRTVQLPFLAEGGPARVALYSGRRLLSAVEAGAVSLPLDPRLLGAGPNQVQPVAEYDNGERVAGRPLAVIIAEPAPPIVHLELHPDGDGVRVQPRVDSGAVSVRSSWFRQFDPAAHPAAFQTRGGRLASGDGAVVLQAGNRPAICAEIHPPRKKAPEELRAELLIPPPGKDTLAGLAFNVRNERNFDFFGLHGGGSGWVLASLGSFGMKIHQAVGDPLEPGRWVDLHLRQAADGVEALVDGDVVCRWPQGRMEKSGVGLVARNANVSFRRWMESRSPSPGDAVDPTGALVLKSTNQPLAFVVWDGFAFSWRALNGRASAETAGSAPSGIPEPASIPDASE